MTSAFANETRCRRVVRVIHVVVLHEDPVRPSAAEHEQPAPRIGGTARSSWFDAIVDPVDHNHGAAAHKQLRLIRVQAAPAGAAQR